MPAKATVFALAVLFAIELISQAVSRRPMRDPHERSETAGQSFTSSRRTSELTPQLSFDHAEPTRMDAPLAAPTLAQRN
jgi:hypothetical protein